ncbi:S-adenosyl-L-methionine-dependent methyltransferase [Aureobasidium subglaciale]|nr:S-adenosyl-L-methionine-dependent methyltransferase [Aureobasidium subglaciale]
MAAQNKLGVVKTYLPESASGHLPKTREDDAWGAQFRTHFNTEENLDKPSDIQKLEAEREARKKHYANIAHDYYELATLSLEFGWNKKFHFAPFLDDKQSLREALAAHDHYQFMTMGVRPGMRGLDAGCGVGEPARQYVRWADVHVTGVTITEYQVFRAQMFAEEEGMTDKVDFVRADYCKMPFPDNHFDFVFAQEATVHAPELRDAYTEMCRVLKPGGFMSVGEWVMTDKFNPKNPQHVDIRRRIERGNGIANMKTAKEAISEFKYTGLDVYHIEDHALKGLQSRPWWLPLDGNTTQFQDRSDWWTVFFLKPAVWHICKAWVKFQGLVGLYNKTDCDTVLEAMNTQGQAVWGLRDGGKQGMRDHHDSAIQYADPAPEIFTPMLMMYGKKPENWVHPDPVKAREAAERVAAAAEEFAKSKDKTT